ncbi:MAG: glutamine--fructose-6-phosphate transaminase (isomerizing) [Candidatus Woesearchaeota archaeon]|nr:MAG: glutamine--fructose-6-phosphate transaminase (isomerizing) [Candidatus Woesearchaeota archaeon]
MCGIVGYIGEKEAAPILLEGLKKLEYRGYDSAGIATLAKNTVHVKKDKGKINDIGFEASLRALPGNIGIAHTRWATHGEVTKENAHPHSDCSGNIIVVHNGIIENYQAIKKTLNLHTITSDTDSELIAHLIEHEMDSGKDFIEASKSALKKLEGNYAVLILNRKENQIVASRDGSPLVIGVGKDEYFPASDIPAFLNHTKKVIYLSDGDFVIINKNLEFFNLEEDKKVEREIDNIEWDAEEAEKGDFDHYMLKEITEQTETIQKAIDQNEDEINYIAKQIKEGYGIFLVACGTAYHACLNAEYLFSKIAKKHINVVSGSEFPHFKHFLKENSLVIAISQSGETADVLEAVKAAKSMKSKVLSIINVKGSSLDRLSDITFYTKAGPEICVLSTKAYTAQVALLLLIAYAIAENLEEGKNNLKNLYNLTYNLTALSTREHIRKLAEKLKEKNHMFTIGRGIMYPTALEAALKLKEVSYIHTEGFAGGNLKHGPVALIEKGTPCIVFVSEDTEKEILSNAAEIRSRGGLIIGIAPKDNDLFDYFIRVPEASFANSITHIIPVQILAYQLALLRGCDPDKPRNLAKSVTVK